MKELSTEEKADRYDRAIEIIKAHYQKIQYSSLSPASRDIEVFEKAFPELREEESEDERIMEDIITYLSTVEDRELIPYETWISWIKKRGEQKSDKVEPKFKVGCVIQQIKSHDNIPLKVVYIGNGSYQCESDDLKIRYSFPIKEQDDWELIEQKPDEWSEEDEAILSWCISDIERAKYCKSQTKPELCDKEINWLKSLKERYTKNSHA